MQYIIIGILLSIGWHVVELIFQVVGELLFERLHKAKWYMIVAGRIPKENKNKSGVVKSVKHQIGFYYTEKIES